MNLRERYYVSGPLGSFILLLALLCFLGLFQDNVVGNEVSKFTDAKAFVDSLWIPNYLSQGSYPYETRQLLFRLVISPLLFSSSFLTISIVGRIACYALLAFALVRLGAALKLKLPLLAIVILLFDWKQSIVAREWILYGFEPKVISYGLMLLALGLLLRKESSLLIISMFVGLACSMHILVGSYGGLALVGVLLCQGRLKGLPVSEVALSLLVFFITAAFAVWAGVEHLWNSSSDLHSLAPFSSDYIYVFVRTPHHLDPSIWPADWWYWLCGYLMLVVASVAVLTRSATCKLDGNLKYAWTSLLIFMLGAMIPFFAGLILYYIDPQEGLLKYYLFRFGDVMLPLSAYLLAACAVEQIGLSFPFADWRSYPIYVLASSICLVFLVIRAPVFVDQYQSLSLFPVQPGRTSPAWIECTQWARQNTAAESLFIVPPKTASTFPWLAQRRMLGTFKQVGLSGGLQEWYLRMSDLAAVDTPWPKRGFQAASWLEDHFRRLTTEQAIALLKKYKADYFLTFASHELSIPLAYRNAEYAVYKAPNGHLASALGRRVQ